MVDTILLKIFHFFFFFFGGGGGQGLPSRVLYIIILSCIDGVLYCIKIKRYNFFTKGYLIILKLLHLCTFYFSRTTTCHQQLHDCMLLKDHANAQLEIRRKTGLLLNRIAVKY